MTTYPYPPRVPAAVLVDVDGTIARRDGRGPYDWDRVGEDHPDHGVLTVVRALHAAGHRLVVMSGRSEVCRRQTEMWLHAHLGAPYEALHMRPAGDNRKDSVVKQELFDTHVRGRYAITAVLDDRRQVVDMWRGLGLLVLDVAGGEY